MAVSGYKQIFMPDYYCATKLGFVAEHRYVAEQKLGRHLKQGEVVHHIDRNKLNNDPDNILVFKTRADHSRYHAGGSLEETEDGSYISRFEKPKVVCEYCYRLFVPKYDGQKYCSIQCSDLSKRKYERPTRAKLKSMIIDFNFNQVATIYKVPNEVLKRWCIAYNLPFRKKDIQKLREKEQKKIEDRQRRAEEMKRQKESDEYRKVDGR